MLQCGLLHSSINKDYSPFLKQAFRLRKYLEAHFTGDVSSAHKKSPFFSEPIILDSILKPRIEKEIKWRHMWHIQLSLPPLSLPSFRSWVASAEKFVTSYVANRSRTNLDVSASAVSTITLSYRSLTITFSKNFCSFRLKKARGSLCCSLQEEAFVLP